MTGLPQCVMPMPCPTCRVPALRLERVRFEEPAEDFLNECRANEKRSLALTWEQVGLRERRIALDPGATKNRQGRIVHMPEERWRTLREQKDLRDLQYPDCPWVFFRDGRPIKDYRWAWKAACKRVGLEGALFHDLRRTGVRNLIRAGVPERVAMEISGHKTRSVFDRYNVR
ncbi:MAG: tyrosine-type recombinase/integrase [Nitrospinota bacterium]